MADPLTPPRTETSAAALSAPAARPQDLDANALRRQARRLAGLAQTPWLHEEVATRMAERLAIIKLQPTRVLQWSGLLGGGEAALLAAYPQAEHRVIEPDAALAERNQALHKRSWWQNALGRGAAVQVQGPEAMAGLKSTPEQDQVGLVWANMALHAESQPPQALAAWHGALQVDGFLMFSCLGPDSFVELRQLFERQGWGRAGPDWWDMHDIGDLLVGAGFADPVMDQERIQLTWAQPADLLKDLRMLGGNVAPERFAGCRGKTWHQRLLQALETLRRPDGRLHLSLEIVYGHAFKPVPKIWVSPEASLTLEQMRAMVRRSGA